MSIYYAYDKKNINKFSYILRKVLVLLGHMLTAKGQFSSAENTKIIPLRCSFILCDFSFYICLHKVNKGKLK